MSCAYGCSVSFSLSLFSAEHCAWHVGAGNNPACALYPSGAFLVLWDWHTASVTWTRDGLLNRASPRDQCTSWLGILTRGKQDERGKETEAGPGGTGRTEERTVATVVQWSQSMRLFGGVTEGRSPRTSVFLLGNSPTRMGSCLNLECTYWSPNTQIQAPFGLYHVVAQSLLPWRQSGQLPAPRSSWNSKVGVSLLALGEPHLEVSWELCGDKGAHRLEQ